MQLEVQRCASHTGQRHRVAHVPVRVHAQQNRAHVGLKRNTGRIRPGTILTNFLFYSFHFFL